MKRRGKKIVMRTQKRKFKEKAKKKKVPEDQRNESTSRSRYSTNYSNESRLITCVAEVHCEDTDSDESGVYQEQKSQSPILKCSLKNRVRAAREEVIEVNTLALNNDSSGEENGRSTPGAISLETDSDSTIKSIDIMRANDIRPHSVGSIRLTGHSSASSPILIDSRRSRSLDLVLDSSQGSTSSSATDLEATHKPTSAVKHNSSLVYGEVASLSTEDEYEMDEETDDKEMDEEIDKEITETSENGESTDDEYDMYEPVTISNPDMDVEKISNDKVAATRYSNGNYKQAGGKSVSSDKTSHETERKDLGPATATQKCRITSEDASFSTEDEETDDKEMDEETGDKEITETSENGKSTDDEHDTYEAGTISSPDMDVEKISNDKVTATRDSNGNHKDTGGKSVLSDKTSHETERKDHGPATSTPKCRITITQSDEINTGQIPSSSAIGTKRALQELPQNPKKIKIDSGTQTTNEDTKWDNFKNNFFVGIPKFYRLCRCKNHTCGH